MPQRSRRTSNNLLMKLESPLSLWACRNRKFGHIARRKMSDSLSAIVHTDEQWMIVGASTLGAALGVTTALFGDKGAAETVKRAVIGGLLGLSAALAWLFWHRRQLPAAYARRLMPSAALESASATAATAAAAPTGQSRAAPAIPSAFAAAASAPPPPPAPAALALPMRAAPPAPVIPAPRASAPIAVRAVPPAPAIPAARAPAAVALRPLAAGAPQHRPPPPTRVALPITNASKVQRILLNR